MPGNNIYSRPPQRDERFERESAIRDEVFGNTLENNNSESNNQTLPNKSTDISELYAKKLALQKKRFLGVKKSFDINLAELSRLFMYPIHMQGIKETFSSAEYSTLVFKIAVYYLTSFFVISVIYFFYYFGVTIALYTIFFGPAGFILAIIHWLLLTNLLAFDLTTRNFQKFTDNIIKVTFKRKNSLELIRPQSPVVAAKSPKWWPQLKSLNFWVDKLPTFLFRAILGQIMVIVAFAISLFPIFGVFILKLLFSPRRGFNYVVPYRQRIKKLSVEEMKELYFHDYARWCALGLAFGAFELIPILSAITMSTNSVAGALWEIDNHAEISPHD